MVTHSRFRSRQKFPALAYTAQPASSSVELSAAIRVRCPRLGCFVSLFCSVTHLVLGRASSSRPNLRGLCPLCGPRKPSVPQPVHSVRFTILWLVPIGSGRPTLVGSRCRQNRQYSSPLKVWRRPLPIKIIGCEPTLRRACARRPLLIQTVCSRRSPPRRAARRTRPSLTCTPRPSPPPPDRPAPFCGQTTPVPAG